MLNYIVLGQVPGTNYFLDFRDVLNLYLGLLVVVLCLVVWKLQHEEQPTRSFDILQLSVLDAEARRRAKKENQLISLYMCLVVLLVMKSSGWRRKQLKKQLSLYYQSY